MCTVSVCIGYLILVFFWFGRNFIIGIEPEVTYMNK